MLTKVICLILREVLRNVIGIRQQLIPLEKMSLSHLTNLKIASVFLSYYVYKYFFNVKYDFIAGYIQTIYFSMP